MHRAAICILVHAAGAIILAGIGILPAVKATRQKPLPIKAVLRSPHSETIALRWIYL
jgi:hypothetical protein